MDFLRAFHVDTERQKPKSLEADRKAERRGVWGRTDGPRDVTTGPASEQSGPEHRGGRVAEVSASQTAARV